MRRYSTPLAHPTIQYVLSLLPSDECVEWPAGVDKDGYGHVSISGKKRLAHRMVYEAAVGLIPGGLPLDHLCRAPRCVNPAHLEPVTNAENLVRGRAYRQAMDPRHYCIRGHRLDEANTRVINQATRVCRACQRENTAAYKARRQAQMSGAIR